MLYLMASSRETTPSDTALQVNVEGTRHVANCCTQLPNVPRLVFTSSVYVYGSSFEQLTCVKEADPVAPDNGYGISKLMAEEVLEQFQPDLPYIIARSFQHTGPRQTGSLLIPEWIDKLRTEASPLEVYNLNTWIDYSDAPPQLQHYTHATIKLSSVESTTYGTTTDSTPSTTPLTAIF